MEEATWSQLPSGPWIWLTERHCGLFSVAENQFGHETTGLNLSLKVRLQIPCPISEFPS